MKIDCLLEVTARFFKAGDKIHHEDLENEYPLTSYGKWHDDKGEDYWDLISAKEKVNIETDNNLTFRPYIMDDEEHYVILKDFIGFSFSTVFFGDFGGNRGSGVYFHDGDLIDNFDEDDLVKYAQEERTKWNADRKQIKENPFYRASNLADETDMVKFILALGYFVDVSPAGPWGGEEYDTRIEIIGKVDTDRLKEIIV